jgi:hypothetical protein
MMSYKVEGLSNKAIRFMGENDDFLREAFNKSRVFIHAIELDGRLKIMLEVDEDTTQEQIRRAAPYALKLRDRLFDFQGAWMLGGRNEFFERLSYLHEGGMIYAEIAERLNARVAEHLREAVIFSDELSRVAPNLKTQLDYLEWSTSPEQKHNPYSFDHAKDILQTIGLKEKDIDEWLKDGVENIRNGKEPFSNGPITRQDVVEKLRTWRNGKKHKSIQAIENKAREEYLKQRASKV